jgi:ferredoxin-NADP reductase/ferredoxin
MPDITLRTRDGAEHAISCDPGATVLAAAETAGLFLPAVCREGTCGACHAQVKAGDYRMGDIAANLLPPAPGAVLLCRCTPQSDIVVDLPYADGAIPRHAPVARPATIEQLVPAGSGAVSLTLAFTPDPALGSAADFIPGQYMELTLPGTGICRAYSLSNLPNWDGRLEFLIRLQPGGAFSTWLGTRARVGDVIETRGPLGHFVLDEASLRPRVLVGGGCGFAPLLSMLRHLADLGDTQPTTLVFGVNRESELFAADAIDELRDVLPQLRVLYSVWQPEGGWTGFTGTAAEALDHVLGEADTTPDIYVCGPPRLMEAVNAVAAARGVPPERVFAENVQPR